MLYAQTKEIKQNLFCRYNYDVFSLAVLSALQWIPVLDK